MFKAELAHTLFSLSCAAVISPVHDLMVFKRKNKLIIILRIYHCRLILSEFNHPLSHSDIVSEEYNWVFYRLEYLHPFQVLGWIFSTHMSGGWYHPNINES